MNDETFTPVIWDVTSSTEYLTLYSKGTLDLQFLIGCKIDFFTRETLSLGESLR